MDNFNFQAPTRVSSAKTLKHKQALFANNMAHTKCSFILVATVQKLLVF